MSGKSQKQPFEMTAAELAAECELITGLPVPKYGCSQDEHMQWFVASCFLCHYRNISDAPTATRLALKFLRGLPNYRSYIPYIEQAMGSVELSE